MEHIHLMHLRMVMGTTALTFRVQTVQGQLTQNG